MIFAEFILRIWNLYWNLEGGIRSLSQNFMGFSRIFEDFRSVLDLKQIMLANPKIQASKSSLSFCTLHIFGHKMQMHILIMLNLATDKGLITVYLHTNVDWNPIRFT